MKGTTCKFCDGAKVEPGYIDCVWCDGTGVEGGLDMSKPVTPQPPSLGGEPEVLGYVLTLNGKTHFEADDNVVISNVPGDQITENHRWVAVVDRAHVARLQAEVERLRALNAELNKSNEEYSGAAVDSGMECDRLTARNAELEGLLSDCRGPVIDASNNAETAANTRLYDGLLLRIDAALNKTNTETAQ